MDAVTEIKARLSIDQLVGQYVQLQKKGRNFVGLCPFHHDSRPSFLVSPDKGICYCFPCQKGGDIFSFYQEIEHVDFKQAIKDLAEQTGVKLPDEPEHAIKKDEKERMRDCLSLAESFYVAQLKGSATSMDYLHKRGLSDEEIASFGLGLAPDSYTATYDHLLKSGFSRKEVLGSGLGIQKDLSDDRVYDRFRHRLMFPIHDVRGKIIGFGGRTMGNDDAKYLNTSDGPLYHKSSVLYLIDRAQKAMREKKRAIIVEGYFDALACHRVGMTEAVATCGTALTEDHVKILKRSVDRVVLCLDQDQAGKAAAERAFILCSKEGLQVEGVHLGQKDPADAAQESPENLKQLLTSGVKPFLSLVLADILQSDVSSSTARHAALERLLPLLVSISSSTERSHAVREAAQALSTTETALSDDLNRFESSSLKGPRTQATPANSVASSSASLYSSVELTLGLLLLYPRNLPLLEELIVPEEGFGAAVYTAIKELSAAAPASITPDMLHISDEHRRKLDILLLYCEENGFGQWNESVATREIKHNCRTANREVLLKKQKDITQKLVEARKNGSTASETELLSQYKQLLDLSRLAQ